MVVHVVCGLPPHFELSLQMLCCAIAWRLLKFKLHTGISADIGRYEFNVWMVLYSTMWPATTYVCHVNLPESMCHVLLFLQIMWI